MKIPNRAYLASIASLSLARIVSEDSQPTRIRERRYGKSSKDS